MPQRAKTVWFDSGGGAMALEIKQTLKELTGKADQLKEYL
jgi:hypothetical protein